MRSLFTKLLFVLTLIMSASSFAITIINDNSKSVKYTIGDSMTCHGVEYANGELSPGGQVLWTKSVYYHPDRVCVHATGWTSSIGAYTYSVNNDNCIIRIKDAGFMKGIKIEKISGC